jgi:L-ascorbate metabolism protein UlaG (beta-lactamase superfamily)
MIITYFGKQFFKIQQGEMTLAFNPVSKNSKTGISTRFGADLALISTNHPDYNGEEQLFHGDRAPFIISGPGDYEVKDIFIKGLLSNAEIENKKYINTIYSLTVDGINLVFLGALSDINLSKEVKEVISEPDIIFVPADGNGLIDAKSSAKLVFSLEPKMIIPMDYTSASLKSFLK